MKYNDISKIQAAESQLKTAIELFFKDRDSISIHTLGSAAQEILESLGVKNKIKSMRLKMLEMAEKDKQKALHNSQEYHKNFFKHADRDPDELTRFDPEYTELVLWDAVRLYYFITQQKVPTFIIYDIWAYAKYPEMYNLSPEEESNYKKVLGTAPCEDKAYFLDLISNLEKDLKKNVNPEDKILFFDNKNFKHVSTEFDDDTKVWNSYYTLNGQSLSDPEPEEEFILNFYLNSIWTNEVTPEKVADTFVKGNNNIVGIPFIAPDEVTKNPAYFIICVTKREGYSYINMTKISSVKTSAFAITYSKKIIGSGINLENNISDLLIKDLSSNVGSAAALGHINVNPSWVAYLQAIQE
jgi:hypothetical protein